MKIQVNSDNGVAKDKPLKELVKANVNEPLERFAAEVTRVEVHLAPVQDMALTPGVVSWRPGQRAAIQS